VIQFKLARFVISIRKNDPEEIGSDDCVGLSPKKGLDINVTKFMCRVTVMLLL
jgi:hypothetical protein